MKGNSLRLTLIRFKERLYAATSLKYCSVKPLLQSNTARLRCNQTTIRTHRRIRLAQKLLRPLWKRPQSLIRYVGKQQIHSDNGKDNSHEIQDYSGSGHFCDAYSLASENHRVWWSCHGHHECHGCRNRRRYSEEQGKDQQAYSTASQYWQKLGQGSHIRSELCLERYTEANNDN